MFHLRRWEEAFLSVSGSEAGQALSVLKNLVPPVKSLASKYSLRGQNAVRRLFPILQESIMAVLGTETKAAQTALRFLCLLIEKNVFHNIDALIVEIEKALDAQNGILAVIVETAVPAEEGFEENLRIRIIEKTGARGVKIILRTAPEILGGCRIMFDGGFCIDASLAGQIKKMKENCF